MLKRLYYLFACIVLVSLTLLFLHPSQTSVPHLSRPLFKNSFFRETVYDDDDNDDRTKLKLKKTSSISLPPKSNSFSILTQPSLSIPNNIQNNNALTSSNSNSNSNPPLLSESENSGDVSHSKALHAQHHRKNLILGLAADTDPKSFAVFAGSIRSVSHSTDVIIFINEPIPERHIEISKKYNVELRGYSVSSLKQKYLHSFHPSTLRWIFFDDLLKMDEYKDYEKVLFADVRDTFLQSDPFDLFSVNSSFLSFREGSFMTIGECGWNSGWVKDCFGENVLSQVESLPIVCSGISMAPLSVAKKYLSVMTSILSGKHAFGKLFPKCERNGVDQGVHNVIVHLNLLGEGTVQLFDETNFLVTHLQTSQLPMSSKTNVLNFDQKLFSVVHQYDRWHSLQVAVAKKYVYWTSVDDEKISWEDEASCSKYKYVSGSDIFAGTCDFGSFRALTSSSCCEACNKKVVVKDNVVKKCSAFAYTNGVCFFKSCSANEIKMVTNSKKSEIKFGSVILQNPEIMSAFMKI